VRGAGSGAAAVVKRGGRAKLQVLGGAAAKSAAPATGLRQAGDLAPVKRLPKLSGAASRLRRAAQLPGIRCVGDAGGQQHRQVNRPKNQCYRESLSWGHMRKRKCNHL